jgi:hypothetical protein
VVEAGLDRREERELGELLVFGAGGPRGFEAEVIAILEPLGDLLDGGLFKVLVGRTTSGEQAAGGRIRTSGGAPIA